MKVIAIVLAVVASVASGEPIHAQARMHSFVQENISYVGTLLFHEDPTGNIRMEAVNVILEPGLYVIVAHEDYDDTYNCQCPKCSVWIKRRRPSGVEVFSLAILPGEPYIVHTLRNRATLMQNGTGSIFKSVLAMYEASKYHATEKAGVRSIAAACGYVELVATATLHFNVELQRQYAGHLVFTESARSNNGVIIDGFLSRLPRNDYFISMHDEKEYTKNCDTVGFIKEFSPDNYFLDIRAWMINHGIISKLFLPNVTLEPNHPHSIIGRNFVFTETSKFEGVNSADTGIRSTACGIVKF